MKVPIVGILRKKTVVTHVYVKLSVSDAILLAEAKDGDTGVCFTVASRVAKVKRHKGNGYLTTNPNSIKDDNLERLPEFDKIGKLAILKYRHEKLRS